MLQAMKAHAQKKFASKATKQGVIDIHAQEGQALTSSLSGTLLCPALPCPALPCPAISLSLSLLAAIVDASGCQLLFLKGLLQSFCIGNVYAPQWQLMPFLKLLHLCLYFAMLRCAVLLGAAAYSARTLQAALLMLLSSIATSFSASSARSIGDKGIFHDDPVITAASLPLEDAINI